MQSLLKIVGTIETDNATTNNNNNVKKDKP